jgi:hypothetical protein
VGQRASASDSLPQGAVSRAATTRKRETSKLGKRDLRDATSLQTRTSALASGHASASLCLCSWLLLPLNRHSCLP